MSVRLRLAGVHHEALRSHLCPGDGLEAVAFALCGRRRDEAGQTLLVRELCAVPHDACRRAADRVTWRTDLLPDLCARAKAQGLAVLRLHSHPTGYERFSKFDDSSDAATFEAIFAWLDSPEPHASAVMLPDGRLFGRAVFEGGFAPLQSIEVAGEAISCWPAEEPRYAPDAHLEAQEQLLGRRTTHLLRQLSAAIVGCSGTGSVVAELLCRLGIGRLVLVDHDKVEARNLNRILGTRHSDIGRAKVEVLAETIHATGLGTIAVPYPRNLYSAEAVRAVAGCDILFGCLDTAEGRHLLNRLATFYLLPYFDLGVHLRADGKGGVDEASAAVHYIQPGRSTLLDRRAYRLETVRAEGLRRQHPERYADGPDADYIEGAQEDSPAVASINGLVGSAAVNEFLARLHPFRSKPPEQCAVIFLNLMETAIHTEEEPASSDTSAHLGRGDVVPLLDYPQLG